MPSRDRHSTRRAFPASFFRSADTHRPDIIEELQAALAQLAEIANDLKR